MDSTLTYYGLAVLLILANAAALAATLFTLPGNWIIVALSALFAFFVPADNGQGLLWLTVGVLLGLAVLGEVVEFLASAAGAAKQGASRRGTILAVVGAIAGSIAGAVIGVPIPILGPLIGTVAGGGLGAFLGAYLGETWKGKAGNERLNVSRAALVGRLLGTLGKLLIGAIMFVLVTVDLFV